MSIAVDLADLECQARSHPFAYLLTVGDDLRAHAVAVSPDFAADGMTTPAGRKTCANAIARPEVSVVWPPSEPGGYSLIVNATAHALHDGLRLVPTSAVLHRPAPADHVADAGGCAHDCKPLGA